MFYLNLCTYSSAGRLNIAECSENQFNVKPSLGYNASAQKRAINIHIKADQKLYFFFGRELLRKPGLASYSDNSFALADAIWFLCTAWTCQSIQPYPLTAYAKFYLCYVAVKKWSYKMTQKSTWQYWIILRKCDRGHCMPT